MAKTRKKKKHDLWWYLDREFGPTAWRRKFTRKTGIPTTEAGVERKIGRWFLDLIFGKDRKKKSNKQKEE